MIFNFTVFILCMIALSISLAAQPPTVSLTSGGYTTSAGERSGTAGSNQSPTATRLTVNLSFGDVSPGNGRGKVVCVVPIRISSAGNYKIEIGLQNASGIGGPQPKDVGFGVSNVRFQRMSASRGIGEEKALEISRDFANDPTRYTIENGQPRFAKTLADIAPGTGTTLFTGAATGAEDLVGTDDGSILADLTFVIVRQYFDVSDGTNMALTLSITSAFDANVEHPVLRQRKNPAKQRERPMINKPSTKPEIP